MAKIKVYALARELDKDTKALLKKFKSLNKDILQQLESIEKMNEKIIKIEEEKRKREELKKRELAQKKEKQQIQSTSDGKEEKSSGEDEQINKPVRHTGQKPATDSDQKSNKPERSLVKSEFSDMDKNKKKIEKEKPNKIFDSGKPKSKKAHSDYKKKNEDFDLEEKLITKLKPRKAKNTNGKEKVDQKVDSAGAQKTKMPAKPITIGEHIAVKELSEKIGIPASELIKRLISLGVMANINQELDFDTACILAEEYDIKLEKKIEKSYEDILSELDNDEKDGCKLPRPPIVTVMGHVDHGKTSLLDAIRNTRVTQQEAGGITQHIGAYQVSINDKVITFLDTPGHEAFTTMRARGAKVTDIAVLVVAADDGVMPQTVEAINHAKAANVPIIVAINKMDKPGVSPDRVKQELTEHGLLPEDWGGDTICVPVSALKQEGIDNLLEMILLVSEMQELKANPEKRARGTIVEAKLDKGRGPVATALVQDGTLKIGDFIIAGTTYGRVRAMINDKGQRIKQAGPSMPVEILGFSDVPEAGDILFDIDDERLAKQVVEERKDKIKEAQITNAQKVSLDELFDKIKEGELKDLNIIIKADVQGSVEAVKQALIKLSNDEVRIKAIHSGVGAITDTDIMLASASNAIIIGFNVRPEPSARAAAEKEKVDIRLYRIIYNAIEDMEAAIKGMLEPKYQETVIGHAEIRTVFKVSGVGSIAGCYVVDGKVTRNSNTRLIRNGVVVHEGKIESLKRYKDDVKDVNAGYECGISIENFNDIKEGDIIEAFIMEEVKE
ncbi:MAG: translation initiation factor IF-2 [Mahellales bacterium]|jgi:translation initiation factor IF-2